MSATAFRRKLGRPDFDRMNLPEVYWRARIQDVQEAAQVPLHKYLQSLHQMVRDGVGLCIHGEESRGKTTCAAVVAKEARSFGYTVYFSTVWEMREMIRAKLSFEDESSVLQRAREVDILILDDLRPEDVDQGWFGRSEIEALIADRAAHKKVTILTTRMSPVDMRQKLTALTEILRGCMVFFPVKGRNLRETRANEMRRSIFGD